jgi:hypothetical protein
MTLNPDDNREPSDPELERSPAKASGLLGHARRRKFVAQIVAVVRRVEDRRS